MCFEFAPKYMFIFQHQALVYSKGYVHSPLVNGNSWYLVSQATIRGPLLLAPALHVVQAQVGQICIVGIPPFFGNCMHPGDTILQDLAVGLQFCRVPGFPGRPLWLCVLVACLPGGFQHLTRLELSVGDSLSRLLRAPWWRVSFQDLRSDL